ncbi:MAG: VCBS repeat-containing protein, partial [Gemmatimonadaceae bacterium]|nr:VCBS repeat-containing protein [Gloeobacterales cyanobacterium ES-bin-141]
NNGNSTFATPQNFATGNSPESVTVGDLDRDGDLDLATANRDDVSVFVLKNNGNGTFTAPQTFVTGGRPFSVSVGDLDGDGDLDLSTANRNYPYPGTVSVLRNNGNGTFTTSQNFVLGNDSISITVGDLDKDGDLDLATDNPQADSISVLQSTTPTLQLSLSPDRSNPVPLAGQTVKGNVYVFASGKDSDFLRVNFYIDDPDKSGEPFRTELVAPFDLSGTSGSKANPSDSRALSNGQHTITATFARTDGTFRTMTSTFTVKN